MIMSNAKQLEHIIEIQVNNFEDIDNKVMTVIKKSVSKTLSSESVDLLCVVSVLLTDDNEIRNFNRKYRGIDKATDVLSFPMQDFDHPGWGGRGDIEIDKDSGELPLGDIIISLQTVERQAIEYGHSLEQEIIYMTIHSVLHLLGYDHYDEKSENDMRNRTEGIILELGLVDD